MPAPGLGVDKEAVKAHAVTHGVREAARNFGLAESTVKSWSTREGWLAPVPVTVMQAPVPKSMRPIASNASTPSEAAVKARDNLDSESRHFSRKYVHGTLKHAAKLARREPERALAAAADVKAVVGVAQGSNMAGFERQQDSRGTAVVNIALLGMIPPEVNSVSTNAELNG